MQSELDMCVCARACEVLTDWHIPDFMPTVFVYTKQS